MDMPTRAGWYDNPDDPEQLRYFDGVVWTKHTTPRRTRAAMPPAATVQPGPALTPPGAGAPPAASGGWQAPHVGSAQVPQGQQVPQAPDQQFPGAPQPGQWNAPGFPAMVPRPTTPDGQPLASYWQRVGAFVLDWIIQSLLALVLGFYFLAKALSGYFDQVGAFMNEAEAGRQPDFTTLTNSIDTRSLAVYSIIAIGVFVVYQTLFLTRTGATPGKMAVGISVRLRERPGPLSTGDALRRVALPVAVFVLQLLPLVSIIGLPLRLLDLLWPAWDSSRQALHDRVAKTNVVVGRQPRG